MNLTDLVKEDYMTAFKIEDSKTLDLSGYTLPELDRNNRVIGNEKYIKIE